VEEEAQQSKKSNSKNTLAERPKEIHALGSNENELKHFAAKHTSTDALIPCSSTAFRSLRPPTGTFSAWQ